MIVYLCVLPGFVGLQIPSDLYRRGYARMVGEYSGEMQFFDLTLNQLQSFRIDARIALPTSFADKDTQNTSVWTMKFRFAPPRYGLEFFAADTQDGERWIERSITERTESKLKGWENFCTGTTNWFEIERKTLSDRGVSDFRRRYTFTPAGMISEKWLKFPGKNWEFSHRMDLKRTQ